MNKFTVYTNNALCALYARLMNIPVAYSPKRNTVTIRGKERYLDSKYREELIAQLIHA